MALSPISVSKSGSAIPTDIARNPYRKNLLIAVFAPVSILLNICLNILEQKSGLWRRLKIQVGSQPDVVIKFGILPLAIYRRLTILLKSPVHPTPQIIAAIKHLNEKPVTY